MPGNPLPEGAPPSAPTDPGSVRADEVLGSLADDLAAEAERSLAEAAVPEPRGGADGARAGAGAVPPGTASEGVAAQDDEAARVKAYEASILAAYGGRRGLAEIGLPTMVFVVIYTATSKLTPSLWAAVAVSAVMALWRLVKREKVQNAISGVLGVVVCAVFARHTGQAKDFYLPGVLLNVGEAVLFGVSALVRWPVVGVVLGPITGEMMAWREHPDRLRAFTRATWMLGAMFVFRVLIEVPLYLANQTTALGAAKVLLGYPLYLMVAFMCWQVIRKAPPPARAEA
ncbi:MAG TPA: DUF3159 domain-containing protein [Actinocrinis sp.]|nr:DUF3159 domain-containing protein [Actinocrinis sp.]